MATDDILEPKRIFRLGFDFALGMMRAAAQGTTTFVDARKRHERLPESASSSVMAFFASAFKGAEESRGELAKERVAQAADDTHGRPNHVAHVERTGEFSGDMIDHRDEHVAQATE